MADKHLLDFVPGFPSTSHHKRESGPCPWCGGEDRFVVFVDDGDYNKGAYHCFQNPGNGCKRGGDAIEFLRKYHEMSFPEAVRALGLEEEKLDGKSPAQKHIEQEKRAPDAALRVKTWNLVKERLYKVKAERKRRKERLRRKRKKERRRKTIEQMNDQEQWLLSEVQVYRRTRQLHRAVARFVTLHARPKGETPCTHEGIGTPITLQKTALELLNEPERFQHVDELYHEFRSGLAEGMPKAPEIDRKETKARQEKLFKLAREAQKQRDQF